MNYVYLTNINTLSACPRLIPSSMITSLLSWDLGRWVTSLYRETVVLHLVFTSIRTPHPSIHSIITFNKVSVTFYDTPSTWTFNVKLRINSARWSACKFIITTIIIHTPFHILSQVCITMQFWITYYSPDFVPLCCVKLDDYINKINKFSLDILKNN